MSERRRVSRGGRITDPATHDQVHVTMRQVTDYFNVGRRIVLKWIENGDLPALKLEGRDGEWRFKTADLVTLAEKLKYRPPAADTSAMRGCA